MLLFMQIDNRELKIKFFQTLNGHQRRQYAAIEAHTLGHGGQRAVSQASDIHADTIRRGMSGLAADRQPPPGRIRKSGGGRKKLRSLRILSARFSRLLRTIPRGCRTMSMNDGWGSASRAYL
ncbi:MAG: hypothetical protein HC887_11710 [Desulfobacteraceae bacterium]|nr:hypothetical protein [Desulfobacteraceae bacterium]